MNFYEAKIKYKQKKISVVNKKRALFIPEDEKDSADFIKSAFNSVNRKFGVECDEREAYSIFFFCHSLYIISL